MTGEIWGSGVGLSIAALRQKFREMQRLEVDMISMDQPGFVKTTSESAIYYADGNAIGISDGTVQEVTDVGAENQLRAIAANAKSATELARLVTEYEDAFGKMGGSNAFLISGNKVATAINTLCSQGGDSPSNKQAVLDAIKSHTRQINIVADKLQNLRNAASQDLAKTVPEMNQLLTDLASLNSSIKEVASYGSNVSYLRQRRVALDKLSQYMEIKVEDTNSDFLVYTTKGRVLVQGDITAKFIYNPPGQVSASATFGPGTITLQSIDVDSTGNSGIADPGILPHYIDRRSEALIFDVSADFSSYIQGSSPGGSVPGQLDFLQGDSVLFAQALDSYAAGLRDSFNAIHNLSSAIAPRTTLQGSAGYIGGTSLAGTLAITAAGTIRVAVVNTTSNLATFTADIDISGVTSVDATLDNTSLCYLINNDITLTGHITASVDPTTNSLKITTTDAGCGVSLGSVSGATAPTISAGAGTYGLSEFFHLNDVITPSASFWRDGAITGLASSITINSSMLANPEYFSVNKLRDDTLGGAQAVSGDPSAGRSLSDLFTRTKISFATPTGGTTLQTLEEFSKGIVKEVATKANDAQVEKEAQTEAYKQQEALFSQDFGMDEQEIAIRSMQISKSQDLYFSFINNYWRMMSKVADMGKQ